jgi:hypothetical protein
VNRRSFLASASAAAAANFGAAAALGRGDRDPARASATATAPATAPATALPTAPAPIEDDGLAWHDVREWGVEGRAFADTESYFDRLPGRAKGIVRDDVWNLSHHTTGMSARFDTDAPVIHVRYALASTSLAMSHMPATGVSGVDLYARDDAGRWRWLAANFPESARITSKLIDGVDPRLRAYHLNFPLYNGVKSLEIGVPRGATFQPTAPRTDRPLLFYGTSITRGACASRPGMSFVNLLGRRLDRQMLNFGFSGNGRTEVGVARFLAELDPAVFVLDCIPNTSADEITPRTVEVVRLLRAAHPKTPVLLLEDRTWANAPLVPRLQAYHAEKRAALRKAFEQLLSEGIALLFHQAGAKLVGADGDASVDGSHPSDLGMLRYADVLGPRLRQILGA